MAAGWLNAATAPAVLFGAMLAVPLIALAVIKALQNPMWLLALYAAVVPFGGALRLPGAGPFGSLSTMLGLLAVAGFIAYRATHPAGAVRPGATPALAVLLVAVAAATMMWSIDVPRTLQQVAVLASLVGLYLVVALTPVSPRDVRRFEVGVLTGAGLVGVYAVYLAATGALGKVEDQRFVAAIGGGETGEVADPNITAAALVLPLTVTLHHAMRPGRIWIRATNLLIAVALVVGLLLTGSRGGLLALIVSGTVLMVTGRSRGVKTAVFVPLSALLLAAVVAPQNVVSRLTSDVDSSGRTDIWLAGFKACPEHCAAGSGWGTFATAHRDVLLDHPEARADRLLVEAHNLWLGVLVEGGLLAFVLVILILWTTARGLRRVERVRRAPALAALGGLIVTSLFLQSLGFKFCWLVLIYGVLIMNESALRPEQTHGRDVAASGLLTGDRA